MFTRDAARELLLAVDHVVPYTAADGLAADAIALRARGEPAAAAVLLQRGETPFGPRPPLPDGSAVVLDWGVRVLERSGILVDHDAPRRAAGPGRRLGVRRAAGDRGGAARPAAAPRGAPVARVRRRVGDPGEAAFALSERAGEPRGAVRRLVPLVSTPRRLPDGSVALALLVESESAAAALRDGRVAALDEARRPGAQSSTASAGRRRS